MKRIEDMGREAEVALDQMGAKTLLRVTISSGEGEMRLRQAVVYTMPKFGQREPTLHALLATAQALDGWVKQHAPDRKDWIVMPFEYLSHFPDECYDEDELP